MTEKDKERFLEHWEKVEMEVELNASKSIFDNKPLPEKDWLKMMCCVFSSDDNELNEADKNPSLKNSRIPPPDKEALKTWDDIQLMKKILKNE